MNLSKEKILPYLLCPCSKKSSISDSFICNLCGDKINFEYGIVNYESGIKNLIKLESKNRNDWSIWRQKNFIFLSGHLLQDRLSVIDLGSGGAQFRELYAGQNLDYISIDLEPYEDLTIRKNLKSGIPIKDESVDVVILNNFIEHFPDTYFILRESLRVLKKGGRVLACIPFLMQAHQVPFDYVRYTHDGLKEVFNRAGFARIEVENPMSVFDSIFSLIQSSLSHVQKTNKSYRIKVKIIKIVCKALFRRLKFYDTDKLSIGFNVVAKKAGY
jgi:SAM-dependent methyltransferase